MIAFERLGLERDADEAQIRRAYARELRGARPDENPAAFQELNQAYRQCLEYAAWRASGGEDWDEEDWTDEVEGEAAAELPRAEAASVDAPTPMPSEALAPDRRLADTDEAEAHTMAPATGDEAGFDAEAFIAKLFEASSVGSGADVHRWLQAHPAFYAIGAREALAPTVLNALIDAPDLPPRHLAALLHFFGLDEVGHARDWLTPQIAVLQQRARLTPEHTPAANELFGQPKPIDEEGGRPMFWTIWVGIMLVVGLVRCGAAALH